MVRPFSVTFAALMVCGAFLSGCATAIDGGSEDIRINVAGAHEALCDVTQPGRRYRAYAPSTFRVMRDNKDLRIRCFAPGNREQVVILKPEISHNEVYNVSNFGLGALWDYGTGAFYAYPDHVLIDFTTMTPQPYPQPDYQTIFEQNPAMVQMEEFRPGKAALTSDIGTSVPTLQKRTHEEDNSMGIMMPVAGSVSPGASSTAAAAAKSLPPITVPAAPKPAAATGTSSPNNTSSTNKGAAASAPNTNTNGAAAKPGVTTNSTSSSPGTMHIFTGKIGNSSSSTTGQ